MRDTSTLQRAREEREARSASILGFSDAASNGEVRGDVRRGEDLTKKRKRRESERERESEDNEAVINRKCVNPVSVVAF